MGKWIMPDKPPPNNPGLALIAALEVYRERLAHLLNLQDRIERDHGRRMYEGGSPSEDAVAAKEAMIEGRVLARQAWDPLAKLIDPAAQWLESLNERFDDVLKLESDYNSTRLVPDGNLGFLAHYVPELTSKIDPIKQAVRSAGVRAAVKFDQRMNGLRERIRETRRLPFSSGRAHDEQTNQPEEGRKLDDTQRAWHSVFSSPIASDPAGLEESAAALRALAKTVITHSTQIEIVNLTVAAAHRGAFTGPRWDVWRARFLDWPSFQVVSEAVPDLNWADWGQIGNAAGYATLLMRLAELIESFASPTKEPFQHQFNDRQKNILQAMLDLKAFDSDTRRNAGETADQAEGSALNEESYKKDIAALVKGGYLQSKKGAKGGCWLTEQGVAAAKQLS